MMLRGGHKIRANKQPAASVTYHYFKKKGMATKASLSYCWLKQMWPKGATVSTHVALQMTDECRAEIKGAMVGPAGKGPNRKTKCKFSSGTTARQSIT